MTVHQFVLRPEAPPPSLAETDVLLAELRRFPRTAEVAEALDTILDYRARVLVVCHACVGARTDIAGGPCHRCAGSGVDPNP